MKVAIIGAGFTGLSAAYTLLDKGHSVSIFEKEEVPGGLAIGYKKKEWEWGLEEYYHHWFTNDQAILSLAKKLHYPVIIRRPKTSSLINKDIYQLDSPLSFLQFPKLSFFERFRMLFVLGLLKLDPFWQPLEKVTASSFLPKAIGQKAYTMLWEPLLKNKFGQYASDISLAWFWARVNKRTSSLAYPSGGFLHFAQSLADAIKTKGGNIYLNTEISAITQKDEKFFINNLGPFDKVVVTLPSFALTKLLPLLPQEYKDSLLSLKSLGAITMVLRLKNSFLTDGTYWLNICDTASPVLAVVEHTNFMDKKHYNNEHLVYLGNYLPSSHEFFSLTKDELLKKFNPFLQTLHKDYEKDLIGFDVFKTPFAQPIIPINYSKHIPPFKTPITNIYLANMQQVYPWDRGTNYAVELGEKIASQIL